MNSRETDIDVNPLIVFQSILFGVLAFMPLIGWSTGRDEILQNAIAHWQLGMGVDSASPALTAVGSIQFEIPAEGPGANVGAQVARLSNAYFNAGPNLDVGGDQITVYLRARDPEASWQYALLAKRGGHDRVNYNLFSVDLAGTTGSDIGFEVRTDRGFVAVTFPISQINGTSWLDLIGRYDGQKIELICGDRMMASQSWSGNLVQNTEPVLIGAETDNGNIVRLFTGDIEEAAIWNRALSNTEIAALARVSGLQEPPGPILHYKHPDHAVGDVHPFYLGGTYYVNYLHSPGVWQSAQLQSGDLLHWEPVQLTHTPPPPENTVPNYFVLDIIYDPIIELYRTFYGFAGTRTSTSPDLVNWEIGVPHLVMPDRPLLYDRQSDPYVFYNIDEDNYWLVQTLRKKNLPYSQAGAVGYAVSNNFTSWTFLGELYYPGNVGDPEVPSMFKMGNKWYLMASFYDRAVGKASYRISDNPYGPWQVPFPDSLDGKDLAAGITFMTDSKRLLMGWIPLVASQPGSQYWGGHLAFPREVYQLPDGNLRTRLESSIASAIRAERLFPSAIRTLVPRTGSWKIEGNQAQLATSTGYGVATLSGAFDRIDMELQLELGPGNFRSGVILNWATGNPGFEIGVDSANSRFLIWSPPNGLVHSELPIQVPLDRPVSLRVIVEEDIIEAFLDDQYSLVARIPVKLSATSVGIFTQDGDVEFSNIHLFRLKSLDEIEDTMQTHPCFQIY